MTIMSNKELFIMQAKQLLDTQRFIQAGVDIKTFNDSKFHKLSKFNLIVDKMEKELSQRILNEFNTVTLINIESMRGTQGRLNVEIDNTLNQLMFASSIVDLESVDISFSWFFGE